MVAKVTELLVNLLGDRCGGVEGRLGEDPQCHPFLFHLENSESRRHRERGGCTAPEGTTELWQRAHVLQVI